MVTHTHKYLVFLLIYSDCVPDLRKQSTCKLLSEFCDES